MLSSAFAKAAAGPRPASDNNYDASCASVPPGRQSSSSICSSLRSL
jgi:hypothetical protein